jgi:hypothetical protein
MDAWPLIKSYVPDAKLVIVGTRNDEDRLQRVDLQKQRSHKWERRGVGVGKPPVRRT